MQEFTKEQIQALSAPIDSKLVRYREGFNGQRLAYLEGWQVIETANRIFGFDGWERHTKRELISTDECFSKGGQKMFAVSYLAQVEISVGCRIRRTGTGAGHGMARNLGDAHESAAKEAETDATKRALATFGNQFGLSLYDKDSKPSASIPASSPVRNTSAHKKVATAKPANELKDDQMPIPAAERQALLSKISNLSDEEREELRKLLIEKGAPIPATGPWGDALTTIGDLLRSEKFLNLKNGVAA